MLPMAYHCRPSLLRSILKDELPCRVLAFHVSSTLPGPSMAINGPILLFEKVDELNVYREKTFTFARSTKLSEVFLPATVMLLQLLPLLVLFHICRLFSAKPFNSASRYLSLKIAFSPVLLDGVIT